MSCKLACVILLLLFRNIPEILPSSSWKKITAENEQGGKSKLEASCSIRVTDKMAMI